VKSLLNARAKVNVRTVFNRTALMAASESGHADVVTALLSAGGELDF